MITYGFELELFITKKTGEPVLVPSPIPYDECGWLAEVRSEPHADIDKAIALFQVEIERVRSMIAKADLCAVQVPSMEIPRKLKVSAARLYSKGQIHYRNLYGHETHKNSTKFQTASIHVSVMNQREHYIDGKLSHKYPAFVDHAALIVGMDHAFKQEIAKAKRNPGFYEVKADGRIEYRSLPNDVSLAKLADVLKGIKL